MKLVIKKDWFSSNPTFIVVFLETTLDYIESEMAKRGVTQELIEEIRALPETKMLQDIQRIHAQGGDLEFRDVDGATPVRSQRSFFACGASIY